MVSGVKPWRAETYSDIHTYTFGKMEPIQNVQSKIDGILLIWNLFIRLLNQCVISITTEHVILTLELGWVCRSSSEVCTYGLPTVVPPHPGPWWQTHRSRPARQWHHGTPPSWAAPGWNARAGSVWSLGSTPACTPSLGRQTLHNTDMEKLNWGFVWRPPIRQILSIVKDEQMGGLV